MDIYKLFMCLENKVHLSILQLLFICTCVCMYVCVNIYMYMFIRFQTRPRLLNVKSIFSVITLSFISAWERHNQKSTLVVDLFIYPCIFFNTYFINIVDITLEEHKLRIAIYILWIDPFIIMIEASSSLDFP